MRLMVSVAAALTLALSIQSVAAQDQCAARLILHPGVPTSALSKIEISVGTDTSVLHSCVAPEGPARTWVLLDSRPSMHYPPSKWNVAMIVLNDLVRSSASGSQLGLVISAGAIYEAIPLVDVATFVRRMDSVGGDIMKLLASTTSTHAANPTLDEAIEETAARFPSRQPGDIVYVITDATERDPRRSSVRATDSLLASGTRLFSFIFVEDYYRFKERALRPEWLMDMTKATGGSWLQYEALTDLDKQKAKETSDSLRRLYSEMHDVCEVKFDIAKSAAGGKVRVNAYDKNGAAIALKYASRLSGCYP